ncbi:hypothetical protein NHX12_010453 [Muraenolepis orangiensis]|uniref:Uncharacterized protein n=1 Tax=Muraenolepis orangiensis TaxID=630683 RepID=A0A9Q0DLC2_9TELE|nr:hypothetical protein NHX12_010453 [Muraenolepis orangiensis]
MNVSLCSLWGSAQHHSPRIQTPRTFPRGYTPNHCYLHAHSTPQPCFTSTRYTATRYTATLLHLKPLHPKPLPPPRPLHPSTMLHLNPLHRNPLHRNPATP